MATVTEMPNRIRLRFETGFNEEGSPTFSTQSFSKVKEDALHDDIYDVANTLAGLCDWTLNSITLEEDKLLY